MAWNEKYKDNERAGRFKLASRVDLAFPKHISTLLRNFKWGSFWANLDTTQQFHYFKILRHNFQVGLIPGGLEYNIAKFSRNSKKISLLEI
jgi:hypothetical protein